MITSWEELGDELAEIHNDLSYLHNSIPTGEGGKIERQVLLTDKVADSRLLTRINQLEAQVNHLEKHVNSLVDKKQKSQYD